MRRGGGRRAMGAPARTARSPSLGAAGFGAPLDIDAPASGRAAPGGSGRRRAARARCSPRSLQPAPGPPSRHTHLTPHAARPARRAPAGAGRGGASGSSTAFGACARACWRRGEGADGELPQQGRGARVRADSEAVARAGARRTSSSEAWRRERFLEASRLRPTRHTPHGGRLPRGRLQREGMRCSGQQRRQQLPLLGLGLARAGRDAPAGATRAGCCCRRSTTCALAGRAEGEAWPRHRARWEA